MAGNRVDPRVAVGAMVAVGLKPLVEYQGRHVPWNRRCSTRANEVSPTYGAIVAGGGCRYCNDTSIDPEVAAAAMRAEELEPLEDYPGSVHPWETPDVMPHEHRLFVRPVRRQRVCGNASIVARARAIPRRGGGSSTSRADRSDWCPHSRRSALRLS